MAMLISNFGQSTLVLPLNPGDNTLTVLDGSRYPEPAAGDWFPVVIASRTAQREEIVYATGRTGNVLTVERAREGTAAESFIVSDIVTHALTASSYDEFLRDGRESLTVTTGVNYADAGGSVNNIVVNVPGINAYTDGLLLRIRAAGRNTGAVTIDLNGLGAVSVTKSGIIPLAAGNIDNRTVHHFTYNAAFGRFILNDPRIVLDTVPTASTTLAGLVRLAETGTTFDTGGDNSRALTQVSASNLVGSYFDTLPIGTIPFQYRYTGAGRKGSATISSGDTINANTIGDNQWNELTISAGATLDCSGTFGVVIIRVRGRFTQNGTLIAPRSGSCWPERHVGPKGAPHSARLTPTSQAIIFPQSDIFGRSTAILPNGGSLSAAMLWNAILGNMPLHYLTGGAGASYNASGLVTIETPPNAAGGGVVVIADEIEIGGGARTLNLHGVPETQYGSGAPQTGPSAGGMILYVANTININPSADYEVGAEGTIEPPTYWSSPANDEQVGGAANGQCFSLQLDPVSLSKVF